MYLNSIQQRVKIVPAETSNSMKRIAQWHASALRGLSLGLASLLCTIAFAQPTEAAVISWNGVLKAVLEDTTLGTYSGGTPELSTFSGTFSFGDTCGSCIVEEFPPDETNYVFTGGSGTLTGLGITTIGVESSIAVVNEQIVTVDSAQLFDMFDMSVNPGSTIDVWTLASETTDSVIEWEISYIYTTTDPFDSTDYTSAPPLNPDLVIFQVDDGDEVDYFALGEVTVVPLPAALWLLGASCFSLIGFSRRK